jgi:energy-coupling factor transporter ATP-binding protein EcfA2
MNRRRNHTYNSARGKKGFHRFGGRATAGGVNYEVRVAASIAVKILAGSRCTVWEGISGADVAVITLQAPEPVDDIVVSLRGTLAHAFISAKDRSGPISLTGRSPAFMETVAAFVAQFLKFSPAARAGNRFVWAVPSTAGRAATRELLGVLDTHRLDAGDTSLAEFLDGRRVGELTALRALISVATKAWKKASGNPPQEDDLRQFLRLIHVEIYDFEFGYRHECMAEEDIRAHIAEEPKDARRIWGKLEHFFSKVDQHGFRVTPALLWQVLTADGFRLKSAPDYTTDITRLRELTKRNLASLKEHTILPFGLKPADAIHIERTDQLSALLTAAKRGHLLITGEAGCGKSGLIHSLAGALQAEGSAVVLLLAEEVFGRDWKGTANLPGIEHAFDDVLVHWPDGARGFLITDALDAVRDVEMQKELRRLLRDVQEGDSHWTVIASVREFDLKHGRQLREAFPGDGVAGHTFNDFAGVAHFYLLGLTEMQLDELANRRAEIRPFLESARQNTKSSALHRSPFYLRLAAELLKNGVTPARLADWNSPAVLLRKFWEGRIEEGDRADERGAVLAAVCRKMVDTRSMALSAKEISLNSADQVALRELRSRGILQSPRLRHGTRVSDEEIRFTHHLLHDYAIARALIPTIPDRFCDFAIGEPLLPIFYRQSFMFSLEELWDADEKREGFWAAALRLESVANLHGITRILAPILAARRVETFGDLQPLLCKVAGVTDPDGPAPKALRHLASGLQDARPDSIRAGAAGWCEFAASLSGLLATAPFIEGPLVHILARLNSIGLESDDGQRSALTRAGRALMANYVAKPVRQGWRYAVSVAVETICRTFSVAPTEGESALLSLLTPERLVQFPHDDLFELARNLKHLGDEGDTVVIRLFEAAFAAEPETGQWQDFGSAILPMRIQSSDQWSMIHYELAEYYEAQTGHNGTLITEAACIAWNATVWRRADRHEKTLPIAATVLFRGKSCELVEDHSHNWERSWEHEENRILTHFEKLLREWAAAGDIAQLNGVLDRFAARNRTSLMWTVLMEAGAEHPVTLGALLRDVLNEPVFLTHLDYAYGAASLLAALHKTGDSTTRERLEKLVRDLPKNARLRRGERRKPTPGWVEYAQNRLLGVLEEANIFLKTVRDLWHARQSAQALPLNRRPESPKVRAHRLSDEELVGLQGINLKEPVNEEMFRLREVLKTFLARDGKKPNMNDFKRHWRVIQRCERAVRQYKKSQPQMVEDLWGHLVGACESIARHATWPKTGARWQTVRRILLKAVRDPIPEVRDDEDRKEDRWPPGWSWPSPRVDAAQGLPFLALRLGKADQTVTAALRKLSGDKSHVVRYNLAEWLAVLEKPDPELMWELIDVFVAKEQRFSVLDAVLQSLGWLWAKTPDQVMVRVQQISESADKNAPAENHIYETLAHTHLFQFLRTGRRNCELYISDLVADCDSPRANKALLAQLHTCRDGGWLTAGDGSKNDAEADPVRGRTWTFFSKLLVTAQAKLKEHRDEWRQLHEHGQPDPGQVKPVQEKLDRAALLVDGIARELYFASGAFADKSDKNKGNLTPAQTLRFWQEAVPLLTMLAEEPHPHTAYQLVQTLYHLLPYAPREVFLLATQSIRSSSAAGFQFESLAVSEVVKLIQRALADHRDLFQSVSGQESECLVALLQALDLFIEAGWAEVRQLTHRLEEIYR